MLSPRKKAALLAAAAVTALTFLFALHQQLDLPLPGASSFLRKVTGNNTRTRPYFAPPPPLHDHPSFTNHPHPSDASQITSKVITTAAGAAVSKPRKKIVYVCSGGCGGWADRQKGIVGAYVLAAMMGRDFGVHITFPCDLQTLMDVRQVNWKVSPGELSGPNYRYVRQVDHDAVVYAQNLVANSNLDDLFPSEVTGITWNMEVVQLLQKHKAAFGIPWLAGVPYPRVYKRVLHDLFALKPDLQKQLDQLQNSRPPGTKLVCAQVRLGKQDGSFPDVESLHSLQDFPVLVNFLSKYNDSGKYRVFFASDSVEILRRAKAKFPEVFLNIPGPITHTDKSRGADACRGFQKAVLDEHALSGCDVLVSSESGIGKIASFVRASDEGLYLFHRNKVDPFTMNGTFPNKSGW